MQTTLNIGHKIKLLSPSKLILKMDTELCTRKLCTKHNFQITMKMMHYELHFATKQFIISYNVHMKTLVRSRLQTCKFEQPVLRT